MKHFDIGRAMRGPCVGLLVAVALGLNGCLISEAPLIAPGEAAFPLPDRVNAERFHPDGNNGWTHDAYDTAYRSGSAYIVTRENSEDEMELILKRIAQNTFIAQTSGNNGGYAYGLLVIQGTTIYEYDVDCEDFDAMDAQRYGFIKNDDGDCTVTSEQGLAAAYLAQLQKGRKPSTAYALR